MKKHLLLIVFCASFFVNASAGTYKLIDIQTPGSLYNSHGLVYETFPMVTSLKLTGHLNAEDFTFLRQYFTGVKMLDLSGVDIYPSTGVNRNNEIINYPEHTLPEYALEYMNLDSLLLPNSLRTLGRYSLSGCNASHVSMPMFLDSVGPYAFYRCLSLKRLTLNHHITKLGVSAFAGCAALDSVVFEATTKEIPTSLFNGCSSLSSIQLPMGIEHIGESAFSGAKSLKHIELPSSLKTIGFAAFQTCESLEVMRIPSSVDSIGSDFMDYCQNLQSLYVFHQVPMRMDFRKVYFAYVPKTAILYVPAGTRELYHYASGWEYFWPNIQEMTGTSLNAPSKHSDLCYYNAKTGRLEWEGLQEQVVISLYDLNGRRIIQTVLTPDAKGVELGNLKTGLYMAKWNSIQGSGCQKIQISNN